MIKEVVKNLKISSTLRINEISKELELKGKKIFKFGFGQSPFEIPEDVNLELKKNSFRNKYLPMQGLLELREVIAKFESSRKNYNYKADNILIGPGTKELMFLLQMLFDGEVILPIPSWVSYEPQAILGRNKVHWLETKREKNWFPTSEDIEKIISKNRDKKTPLLGVAFKMSTELVAAVLVGSIIGFIFDTWFGTKPWLILTFFFVGVIAGVLNVVRSAKNMQK